MIYCNFCGKESIGGILYKDGEYMICNSCKSIVENHSSSHSPNKSESETRSSISSQQVQTGSDTIQSKHKAEIDKDYPLGHINNPKTMLWTDAERDYDEKCRKEDGKVIE